MKRSIAILICFAGLLASLPAFAAQTTPPAAPVPAVAPAPQLDAPAAAPLPAWLAPAGAPPLAGPRGERALLRAGLGVGDAPPAAAVIPVDTEQVAGLYLRHCGGQDG